MSGSCSRNISERFRSSLAGLGIQDPGGEWGREAGTAQGHRDI